MVKSDFNFKKINDKTYLITNYAGRYAFLSEKEFRLFCTGSDLAGEVRPVLENAYFCSKSNSEQFMDDYAQAIRRYRSYLFTGTGLHIFVLTSRCNLKCVYCQASTHADGRKMTKDIAQKSVDLALQSPNKYLSFEFQGGEPLLNFEVLKFIVEYTELHAGDKIVEFNLVSNLTLLDDEMTDFFTAHHVNISTSLDGHELLQNINRPYPGNNGYFLWKEKLHKIQRSSGQKCGAIQTTTRNSLPYYREIVDEYIANGFERVFVRPLTPLGYAASRWKQIGYTPEEFMDFYRNIFEYILTRAKRGDKIAEGHACIFLDKIFNQRAGSYTELISPCGAGFGQLAYNYDGNIYTCDEGRMLAEMGDFTFKLGDVTTPYRELFDNPVCKTVAHASCLESIPQCESCVYSPYCGTCPVLNYYEKHSAFMTSPNGYKCKIYKGILDAIFLKLLEGDEEDIRTLRHWVERC
jgi:His-Xaa-Ser system radical SAM maturase HxsB